MTASRHIYIKIKKGMYGLKEAAILAYDNLKNNMKQYRYQQVLGTTGMWEHATRRTKFCICVDDFGIKYFSKDDAQHLLDWIEKHYKYTMN